VEIETTHTQRGNPSYTYVISRREGESAGQYDGTASGMIEATTTTDMRHIIEINRANRPVSRGYNLPVRLCRNTNHRTAAGRETDISIRLVRLVKPPYTKAVQLITTI
jgi:hypothetical protein